MSTYAERRSARHPRGRDAPASSSRHPAPSSRRRAAEEAPAPASPSTSASTSPAPQSDEEDQDSTHSLRLLPYTRLTVGDGARREAEKLGETEVKKKAAELVRYALACEYQRVLIRKDDIRNKVLEKSGSRAFSVVFNAAQKMLHNTFGFHMVEVRPRGADNAELAKQAEQVLRAAASSANGLRPRGQRAESAEPAGDGSLGSNIWVLRSALPSSINKALVSVDQGLSKAFAQSTSSEPSTSTPSRRRSAANNAKAALDWSSADHQTGEMGLLYIILALILVNGRTISEATLHMYLRRIHLHPDTPLPSDLRGTGPAFGSSSGASQSTQTQSRGRSVPGTLEGFLNSMVKQSYLERQRSDVADVMDAAVTQAQTQGRRRGRTSGGGRAGADEESIVWEWRWGSRAEAEVGEKRIAELISQLFLDPTAAPDGASAAGANDDEDTQAIDRDRLAKRRKVLLANIASVAGSQLVD
ncbi:MAGE-domain-containing protein [Moesziomyces antarcticus]|uniref:Uncharacterized protein n=2 Tax=Pseudozyma antarctica TaxID=84753 RepID=A0A5C3FMD2_PSEA2|nr:MAGE-domain-containing protein [Moesziomyces antarcticus]GAK65753.1 MAGE-domain-containing protein [Moesziomyces antarcticus]SPO45380.1 uncharacterized protein PSANT_03066 [Moesziomyces antarcticus]